MPTIIERGGRFLARVRKDGFKPVSRTFDRKRDALAWGRTVEADMQAGRWADERALAPTVREALKDYRSQVADRLKGAEFYAFTWDKLIQEPWTAKRMNEVTAVDVSGWRTAMTAAGLAAGTVVRRLGLLSGFFTWAMDRGWVQASPVKGVRRPRVNDARDRVLTDEERRWLLAGAAAGRQVWLSDALVVLLHSAMRRGELWGLTVGDVDLSKGVARLSSERTKTGKAREVPLDGPAREALGRLAERAAGQAEAAALPTEGARLIPVSDAPAVSLAFRRALARGRALYADQCKAEGCKPVPGFLEGVRLHDCRHTAATTWAAAGLSVAELRAVTGHATLAALSRYVNLDAGTLAKKLHGMGQQVAAVVGERTAA